MKQKFHSAGCLLLFLVLLISSTKHTSARKLAAKGGEGDDKINNIRSMISVVKMKSSDYFSKLIGVEECEIENEECLKRRIVEEAHLDYIYTQQLKP